MYDRDDKKKPFLVNDEFNKMGYVIIARPNERFDSLMTKIPGEKVKILSMWDGYLKEGTDAYNENLAKSLEDGYDYMHTSGHIDMKDMREFLSILNPKGVIPIHTDNPEQFAKEFGNEWQVHLLNDGDSISL